MLIVMDSYEKNLLIVFESCDDFHQGSLSAAGLHQLCEKLMLQDSYHKLAQYLLGDSKAERIYFHDFKECLLNFLESAETTDGKYAPEKECHTKYHENKNIRKLKSGNSEFDGFSSEDSSTAPQNSSQALCYSANNNSSEESVPKKKKTKSKKKGKNSINTYGKSEHQEAPAALSGTMSEVEHLVSAWASVSRGVGDCLSRDELVRVFECVGLDRDSEEAAECIFEKLGLGENGGITLQELLEFIRTGGSWNREARNQHMELETTQKGGSIEFVEPPRLGCITGGYLVERWDRAGVPSALQLLQNLGYSPSQQIDISSLVALLSEEVSNLNDEFKSTSKRGMDPHVALLRASSVLQNIYIQSLKTTIEHLNAEKEKLRNDVIEANQRAVFLAQEVDDHHSKLEHSTQQQVKILEQKHAEKIREITSRAKSEQDALMAQNLTLERRVKSLEEEENKSRAVISQLEAEARLSEQEHRAVVDQLHAVQRAKGKLEKELESASVVQRKVSEMEAVLNETEVASLLERIRILEFEKTNLRDRNDELSVEVEELSAKLFNSSIKKRSNSSGVVPSDQAVEEGVSGGAVKRRVDAFLLVESAEDSGGEEESPRLGKVRKCSHAKDFPETTSSLKDLRIHNGNGAELSTEDSQLIEVDDVSDCKSENSGQIMPFAKELEQVNKLFLSSPSFQEDWCDDVKDILKKIYEKIQKHDAMLANEVMSTLRQIITDKNSKRIQDVEEGLKNRCKELESSLELLKEEYEKTEDYWSEKLEEERSLFEEEQKVSDKKYSELLEKILEYEETLNAEKEQRQRLETIEEKDSFEKQVTDMEQECAELRVKLAEALKEKKEETERLRGEIERLKRTRECVECGVQTSSAESADRDENNVNEESENHNRKILKTGSDLAMMPLSEEMKNLHQTKLKCQLEVDLMKEEKDRLFQQITTLKQNLVSCGVNEKVQELEQKCHSLMVTLKQQQKQTEDILKNTWKQHKAEMKDLKSILRMTEEKLKRQTKVIQDQLAKLVKTDLLVKDLFVENAYLVSSVQKLERQYQSSGNNSKAGL